MITHPINTLVLLIRIEQAGNLGGVVVDGVAVVVDAVVADAVVADAIRIFIICFYNFWFIRNYSVSRCMAFVKTIVSNWVNF